MLRRVLIATLVAICLALALAVMLRVIGPHGHMSAKINVCRMQMSQLTKELFWYEYQTGRFPRADEWVEQLKHLSTSASDKEEISSLLKCPCDTTDSVTSYWLNPEFAGKTRKGVSQKDRPQIALLREKNFMGSHHWVSYLDGHVERASPVGQ